MKKLTVEELVRDLRSAGDMQFSDDFWAHGVFASMAANGRRTTADSRALRTLHLIVGMSTSDEWTGWTGVFHMSPMERALILDLAAVLIETGEVQ